MLQPVQMAGQSPVMKMKWTQQAYPQITKTNITLDNGNRLLIRETPGVYKLRTLYDSAGRWIKSKLMYFNGRQVVREYASENKGE